MQASSLEEGTALLLQLAALNQLPPAVFVQVLVQPAALAEPANKAVSNASAAIAVTVVRTPARACSFDQSIVPSVVILWRAPIRDADLRCRDQPGPTLPLMCARNLTAPSH